MEEEGLHGVIVVVVVKKGVALVVEVVVGVVVMVGGDDDCVGSCGSCCCSGGCVSTNKDGGVDAIVGMIDQLQYYGIVGACLDSIELN